MQHLNHVHRRGAVYVWRRRLPSRHGGTQDVIQVSLRTREFSTAKILAGLLNREFSSFILRVKTQRITRAEAQQFLSAIVASELERIEAERYSEPQASTPDEWRNRYLDERARSVALLKVATMGPAASLFEEDRLELALDGFDQCGLARIERHIVDLIGSLDVDFERETAALAETQLCRRDFTENDLRALSKIRLMGKSHAMKRSDRRKQATPFFDIEPSAEPVAAAPTPLASVPERPKSSPVREGYSDRLADLHNAYIRESFADVADPAEQKKVVKNRRQNDTVVSQFCDAIGRDRLSEVRQEDMHYYVSVLARMPKIYNRSTKDRRLSLPELLERADDLPDDEVGLAENTINRNITILGNFLKFARGRGSRPAEELFLSDLRKKGSEDERSARMAFTDEDVEQLARHPIWVGCQSPSRRNAPGNYLIKDGLYWVPILAEATGGRREEIVALAVEDVVLNDAIPHILIRPNANRRLKNRSSKRAIPIHSRLIELGFLNYVRQIIAEGKVDLFPELRPDSPTETFGNVFYKPWKTALDQQLSKSAERKTFHSFRHRVITRLRHNPSIDKAWVKDLVGHRHEDETDGRYRDPTPLAQLQEAVEAIPVTF